VRAKLKEIKEELWRQMHWPIPEQGKWLAQVIRGLFNYHAVPTNFAALGEFRHQVIRIWLRTLRRRSETDDTPWTRMEKLAEDFLPKPKILHPWPAGALRRQIPEVGEAMGRDGGVATSPFVEPMEMPVAHANDLSRSIITFEQATTLVVVAELSAKSRLVAGTVPGVQRQPLKKLEPDAPGLLRLVERWRSEAIKAGRTINRVVLAYEAGRDGFWLARWLIARGIEVYVIHSASVAVSRDRKRAKTDRLDAAMLMRVFLGWLRGERGHCGMVAIPTLKEEDARRPSRERESLVNERTRIVNRMKSALVRLGVQGFKPHLRKASQRLEALRTPEGEGLPANTIAELRRGMVRLALVREHRCHRKGTDREASARS
jgi:hypothetical protein